MSNPNPLESKSLSSPPVILPILSKEFLAKLKLNNKTNNTKKSYMQAFKNNIKDIIYIKEVFLKLPTKKVVKINDIINNNKMDLVKPKINMTTKELSRKQVVISMILKNIEFIVNSANVQIVNINRCLKKAKLKTVADYIQVETNKIITTNKTTSSLDLSIIKKCLKENDNINLDQV